MKDIVLQGIVDAFADDRGLTALPASEVFEYFTLSCVLHKFHQTNVLDIQDDILVGGSQDAGIDAVAILVNGHPIHCEEDVDGFIDQFGSLNVDFVFVQSKMSSAFRGADIGTFLVGVEQFFIPDRHLPLNPALGRLADLTQFIFSRSPHMQSNPKCSIYYVTSGIWQDQADVSGRIEQGKQQLKRLNLFSEVKFAPIGSDILKDIYRELRYGVTKSVQINRIAAFPPIDGVEQAHIGLIPGDQFIELVTNDEGELNLDLFYDNIRHFQGYDDNAVNREIDGTLKNDSIRNSFPLLNNGVTIVAKQLKQTGDIFTLSDFQIVNGCQTTHIIFENRHSVDPSTFVPIKLVATGDSQVVTEVVKATNRQTVVHPEALESLSPFHRELEAFYLTQERRTNPKERVYYERRSKQYAADNIKSSNIITLASQVQSFVSMFMNQPHSYYHYYGELLKANQSRLFIDGHKPAPYYASGVARVIVERLFNSILLDRRLRVYRHHVLMLLKMQIAGTDIPSSSNDSITRYSLMIVDALRDQSRCHQECEKAIGLIEETLAGFDMSGLSPQDRRRNSPDRRRDFTRQLLDAFQSRNPDNDDVEERVTSAVCERAEDW